MRKTASICVLEAFIWTLYSSAQNIGSELPCQLQMKAQQTSILLRMNCCSSAIQCRVYYRLALTDQFKEAICGETMCTSACKDKLMDGLVPSTKYLFMISLLYRKNDTTHHQQFFIEQWTNAHDTVFRPLHVGAHHIEFGIHTLKADAVCRLFLLEHDAADPPSYDIRYRQFEPARCSGPCGEVCTNKTVVGLKQNLFYTFMLETTASHGRPLYLDLRTTLHDNYAAIVTATPLGFVVGLANRDPLVVKFRTTLLLPEWQPPANCLNLSTTREIVGTIAIPRERRLTLVLDDLIDESKDDARAKRLTAMLDGKEAVSCSVRYKTPSYFFTVRALQAGAMRCEEVLSPSSDTSVEIVGADRRRKYSITLTGTANVLPSQFVVVGNEITAI